MKKLLLSSLALSLSMAGFSQTFMTFEGGKDDFSGAEFSTAVSCEQNEANDDIAYTGLFWFSDEVSNVGVPAECASPTGNNGAGGCDIVAFSRTVTRNVGSMVVELEIPYGSYEPATGITFGKYFATPTAESFTMDLSGNANVEVVFEVDGGSNGDNAKVTFQLVDINGVALAFDKTKHDATPQIPSWQADLGFAHNNGPGAAANLVAPNVEKTFTFDFANAYPANNANDNYATDGRTFDYTKVVQLGITVTNANRYETGDYNPHQFDPTLTIKSLKIGNQDFADADIYYECNWCPSIACATGVNDEYLASLIKVSPNPTSGQATIDLGAINGDIQVIDPLQTDITAEVLNGTSVDLSGRAAGIYFIIVNTAEGRAVKRISKQ